MNNETGTDIISYTTVNHVARRKLGLTMNEYAVADVIYHLCSSPKNDYVGWCYASKEYIGNFIGLSDRTVKTIINTLLEKNLLEKNPITKHLKTTKDWYDNAIISKSEDSSLGVKNLPPTLGRNFTPDCEDSSHNNNIYKDIDKERKPKNSFPTLESVTEQHMKEIADRQSVDMEDVKKVGEDVRLKIEAGTVKKPKNYKAGLEVWVKNAIKWGDIKQKKGYWHEALEEIGIGPANIANLQPGH